MTYVAMTGPPSGRHPLAVLVGQDPSPRWSGEPRHLLAGSTFWRLAERVLWPGNPRARSLYLRTFLRANVVARHVPAAEPWPHDEARAGARAILAASKGLPLVLLGRRAADAFGYDDRQIPSLIEGGRTLLLPHPSGRCRQWNDPEAGRRAAELWWTLCREHGIPT